MRSIARYFLPILLVLAPSLYALPYPITTPTGETAGGTYRMYFDNIFSSEILCDGANMVVGGFDSIGQPICVTPVSTGLYVTGQTLGDTLRFDGSSWVRNNLIYNNGTSVGIANQTPAYLFDVGGTANFLGIRLPTGAASGYVLTSDPSGVARWSDAPAISLSGITGGTEFVVPKFGPSGTGLILSSIYDNGVTVGINTLVPSALYKFDVAGGDARINGIRFGVGGGNLSSNVAIGLNAFGANVTSPNNVIIGNIAGSTLTAGAGGNILIGNAVNTTSATSSNELNIGNWIYGSNGNIGIGTGGGLTTRLRVDGQIQITGGNPGAGLYLQSDATGIGIWTGVTASSVTASGITGGTEYYLTKFGAGGNGLFPSILYESAGKIGLNNINPSVELDVNGTIRVRSGALFGYVLTSDIDGVASWQPPGVSMNSWNIVGNSGTTAGTHFLGTSDNQDLIIRTNNADRMRILSTGNIGIGTATPGQRLTVSGGTLQLLNGTQANGRMLISDANGVASWTGVIVATNLNLAGAVTGSTLFFRSGSWNVGTGIYNAGGNIGIGTATPGAALEIAGQIKITGGTPGVNKILLSDATGLATWSTGFSGATTATGIYGSSGFYIPYFGTGGVGLYPSFMFYTGGRIGINTTNPEYTFDVQGNSGIIRASSGFCLGMTATGCLSDWSDLNNLVKSKGTPNYIAKFDSGGVINNSQLYESGGNLWIGDIPGIAAGGATIANITIESASSTNSSRPFITLSEMGGQECRMWITGANKLGSNCQWAGGTAGFAFNPNQIIRADSAGTDLTGSIMYNTTTGIGIGTQSPTTNLHVSGSALVTGNLTVQGRLIVDTIVNRSVTNISVSGGILPDTAAPLSVRNLGSNGTRWNNLFLSGQIAIGGGSPGLGRVLVSDATGLASWTGVITATALNIPGSVRGSTLYNNGTAWVSGTGIYNTGGNIGIGSNAPSAKLTIDSGVNNLAGIRISRIGAATPIFTGTAAPLGVDGSGNVVVAQQGAIPVYTALGATPSSAPNSSTNPPTIGANYDNYFDISARQSFTVTDVGGNPYNCPEFNLGTVNKGTTGCSQTPWATYVMTAQNATSGDRYAYQILISDRVDAPFVVRGGMFDESDGNLENTAMTVPALWFKALTVPTNRSNWLYVNPGVDQNNNPITGGGNVGIGTMTPASRFEIWNLNSGGTWSNSLMHFQGTNNIGLGSGSVRIGLTGNANSGYGHESLYTLTNGYSNTAIGYRSMRLTTSGFNNSALGQESLYNNAGGSWNTALGYQASYSNTNGTGNIAIGPLSVYYNSIGANNIGIGYYALRGTSGNSTSNNIAIGLNSLSGAIGNNNIAIGAEAGTNQRSGTNNIALGYDAEVGSPTGSNQLSIGNWIYGSGGNIGIGIANPTADLEVAGQIKITGGSPGAGKVLTSDATGLATWQTPSGGGGTAGWGFSGNTIGANDYIGTNNAEDLRLYTNGVLRMDIDPSGNVGIGTSTGTSKLDVAGTVKLGSNGTQFNAIIRATITRDIANTTAGTCRNEDFTVPNALTTGSVMVSPSANHEDRFIISAARVRAAGIVEVEFCNVSTANINPTSKNYYITVIQ